MSFIRITYNALKGLKFGKANLLPDQFFKFHYRTFIKTLNELSYYKLALFLNLRELAQAVNLAL